MVHPIAVTTKQVSERQIPSASVSANSSRYDFRSLHTSSYSLIVSLIISLIIHIVTIVSSMARCLT